ncbi:helix-turn-helix transcriptional regulator [Streptococcus gallolyticus]|nr:helix-turn-helix transcriptional regulator [Streptococcus gallolyticus]
MELERRLVELRKEKNFSQEELAEKLYVSRQIISNTVFD